MRQWYIALTQKERFIVQQLKKMMAEPYGYDLSRASYYANITPVKAQQLMTRAKVTPAEMAARRKDYIQRKMNGSTSHRHTPYVIACYFGCEEPYVLQLIREMRAEGMLPPAKDTDKEWQEDVLSTLRKKYPNVFRAETVRKTHEVGDKVFVAGKGWLSWKQCKTLAKKLEKTAA